MADTFSLLCQPDSAGQLVHDKCNNRWAKMRLLPTAQIRLHSKRPEQQDRF